MKKDEAKKNNKSSYPIFLGMAQRVLNKNGSWTIKLVWSRITFVLFILGVFAYMLFSLAIYSYFRYFRDYEEMTFLAAMKVPFAREAHREAVGNYNIKKAKEFLKEGKYRDAYSALAVGCSRAPRNLEGRKMLAEFYQVLFKRPDRALETLERSLVYAINDISYIRLYTKLLIDQTEDARLISVGEKILAMPQLKSQDVKLYVAMALSTVYAYHGNYLKSKDFIEKYGLEKTLPGILRLSKNEWELGNREKAIGILAENINVPQNKEAIYALLVNYYVIMRDFDKARQYSMLRSLENPFSMEQRMEYLTLLKNSGDAEGVKRDMEIFFNTYQDNNRSILYLANFAADIGDLPFMRRIYDLALRKDFPIAPYCLLLLETTIAQGDYKAAVAFVEDIMTTKPKWKERHEDVILCLRAVAYYAVGNANMADVLVRDIVKRNTIPVKVMVATSRMFDKLDAPEISLKILERAVELYPKHQMALTRLIQAELKVGISTDLHNHVVKLLKMRRPPRELIADARVSICSDKFIFASNREAIINEIDYLMNNKDGNRAFTDSSDSIDNNRLLDTSNVDF